MYESFYKLRQSPFQLAPDPSYFFSSSTHRHGLVKLRQSLSTNDRVTLITGNEGLGKTELMLNFESELDPERVAVASVRVSGIEASNLMYFFATAFGIEYSDGIGSSVMSSFDKLFNELAREGKCIILLVDDAQNLSESAVRDIARLSNIGSDCGAIVKVYLFGEEAVINKLGQAELDQLLEVDSYFELSALKETETRDYIEHRLLQAGWQGDPNFSTIACELIHEYSEGIPRQINLLCDRALVQACLDETHEIDENLVRIFDSNNQLESMHTPSYGSSNKVVGINDINKASQARYIKEDNGNVNRVEPHMDDDHKSASTSEEFIDTLEMDRPLYEDDSEMRLNDVESAFDAINSSMEDDGGDITRPHRVRKKLNHFIEKARSAKSKYIPKPEENENGLLDHGLKAMAAMYKHDEHGYRPKSAAQWQASKQKTPDGGEPTRPAFDQRQKVIIDDFATEDQYPTQSDSELTETYLDAPGGIVGKAPEELIIEDDEYQYPGAEQYLEPQIEASRDEITERYSASNDNANNHNSDQVESEPAKMVIDDFDGGYDYYTPGEGKSEFDPKPITEYKNNARPFYIAVGASVATALVIVTAIWALTDATDETQLVVSAQQKTDISTGSETASATEIKDPFGSGSSIAQAEENQGVTLAQIPADESIVAGQSLGDGVPLPTMDKVISTIVERDAGTSRVTSDEYVFVDEESGANAREPIITVLDEGTPQAQTSVPSQVNKNTAVIMADSTPKQISAGRSSSTPGKTSNSKQIIKSEKHRQVKAEKQAKSTKLAKVNKPAKPAIAEKHNAIEKAATSRTQQLKNQMGVVSTPSSQIALQQPVAKPAPTESRSLQTSDLNRLMANFLKAYEKGSIKQMRRLLSEDVRSNDAHNRKQVENDFRKLFDVTDLRKITISGINWAKKDNKMFGQASFQIQVREKGDNRITSYSGLLRMDVIKGKQGALIKRLDYHYL